MYYFAYGSNLLLSRMKFRVPSARQVCIAELKGERLVFNLLVGGSGKCDIVETRMPDDIVWGVIYSLRGRHLGRLDRAEGNGGIYLRELKTIKGIYDKDYTCWVYRGVNQSRWHRNSLLPFDWYLHHVVEGAWDSGLPLDYIEELRQTPAMQDLDAARFNKESTFWGK